MDGLDERVLAIVIGVEQQSPDGVMARLGELAGLAEACRTAFLTVGSASNWEPAPGSDGAKVREALNTVDPAVTADGTAADGIPAGFELVQDVVVTYLQVAAGHLAGLAALYRSGEAMFPPIPLIRSIVELSAHAMWVIGDDPQLGPTAMLARAYLEEFDSCESSKDAAVKMHGKESTAYQVARTRRTTVRDRAMTTFPGTTPAHLERGKHPHINGGEPGRTIAGQILVGPTAGVVWMFDLLERFGGGSVNNDQAKGIYAFLCAGTHPSLYQARQMRRGGHGLHVDIETLERRLKLAIVAYYKALRFTIDFLGCDRAPHEKLTADIDRVFPGWLTDGPTE